MFLLLVLIKAGLAASVVVGATIAVERAGPFWGACIAALPIAATPAYIVIALEHPPDFVVASLLGSLASNAAVFGFLTVMALAATRLTNWKALAITLVVWLSGVLLIQQVQWSAVGAFLLNLTICVLGIVIVRTQALKVAPIMRVSLRWWEIGFRAVLVAILIGTISLAGELIGPKATGVLAVFPVVYTSMSAILLLRHGGEATASMMVNSFVPLMGFTTAVLVAHLATQALGVWTGLAMGFATSLLCSAFLLTWRQMRSQAVAD